MAEHFVTVELNDLLIGEALPTTIYLYIDFRFITFRAEDDTVDRATFERLELKKVKNLFIIEKDRQKFFDWSNRQKQEPKPPLATDNKGFTQAREEARRTTYDIFRSDHPDKIVSQTLNSSKHLVTEVMKFPYAAPTLLQLQTYSKGTVDHSVNVSVLAGYLAMQMGYSHTLILQHVCAGGLLHDLGKTKIKIAENDTEEVIEKKMADHPALGLKLIEAQSKVPNEVKMIIAQHHECHDGSGFPKKLRGNAIYDLARIVSIANVFDELVADGKGSLIERQKAAIHELDQVLYRKFDPQKLDKALKILKLGV